MFSVDLSIKRAITEMQELQEESCKKAVRNTEPVYTRKAVCMERLSSASSDFCSCCFALLDLNNALQDKIALLPWKHAASHG